MTLAHVLIGVALGFVTFMLHALVIDFRAKRREKALPTIDEFIGSDPDFTGGKSTKEYIEEMRE
jgi:hypothetical protein